MRFDRRGEGLLGSQGLGEVDAEAVHEAVGDGLDRAVGQDVHDGLSAEDGDPAFGLVEADVGHAQAVELDTLH